MWKTMQGLAAWIGVWVCFCAIADYVIAIETNAWAMAFGVLAKAVADKVEEWLKR